ncbi:MAG: tetratricopeptide repeat protein [Syntrophobacterales bacterium]|nr:tetratricopeptide repeat protein [Syntrophobacterales bacterium]
MKNHRMIRFLLVCVVLSGLMACVPPPPPPTPPTPTAEDHFRSGLSYFKDGYFDSAISSFQAAIGLRPNYTEAYYYLGQSYEKKNMVDKAEAAYRDAIRTNPRYLEAHEALGLLLFRLNRFPEAKPELEMAVNLGSVSPEVYTKLGEIYLAERQCQRAIDMFKKALSLNSNFYPAQDGLKRAQAICKVPGSGYKPPTDGDKRGTKKLRTFQGGGKAISPEEF